MIGFVADTICNSLSFTSRAINYFSDTQKSPEPQPSFFRKVDDVVHSVVCEGVKNGINFLAFQRYKDIAINTLCVSITPLVPLVAKLNTFGLDVPTTVNSCKDALPLVSQIATGIKIIEAAALVLRISSRTHQNWGETLSDSIQVASHWYQLEQLEEIIQKSIK